MPNNNDKKRPTDVDGGEDLPADKKVAVAKDDDPEAKPDPVSASEPTDPTIDTEKEFALLFPSLKDPLESPAPILGLYFASSWCPDCTAVTPKLHEVFCSSANDENNKVFDLIYVSSDYADEQLMGNLPSAGWGFVPFDNVEERSNLKRHFGACAAKEVADLGITPEDRKSGIPTLILLEKQTGKVLTRDAVDDIVGDDGSEAVLQKWKEML
jgi:thiol-disulfide isomerase/thioredoxin